MAFNEGLNSSAVGSSSSSSAVGPPVSSPNWSTMSSLSPKWMEEGRKCRALSVAWTERPRGDRSLAGDSSALVSHCPVMTATTTMRRSVSFDRVSTTPGHLAGDCSRTPASNLRNNGVHLLHCGIVLTAEKWTQTTEDLTDLDSRCSEKRFTYEYSKSCSKCSDFTDFDSEGRMTHGGDDSVSSGITKSSAVKSSAAGSCRSTTCSSCLLLSSQTRAVVGVTGLQGKNLISTCQGSAEGFNQEIEKLVQNTGESNAEKEEIKMPTPDGHRAPIAELLRMAGSSSTSRFLDAFSDADRHFFRIPEDFQDAVSSVPSIPNGAATFSSVVACTSAASEGCMSVRCNKPTNVIISPSPVVCKSLWSRQKPLDPKPDGKIFNVSGAHFGLSHPVRVSSSSNCNIPSEHSAFCPLYKSYIGRCVS